MDAFNLGGLQDQLRQLFTVPVVIANDDMVDNLREGRALDVAVIEAELAKLAEQPLSRDWRAAPLAEIIDHIIVRYHDRHREQLP